MIGAMTAWPIRAGWLTTLAVAAVVGVNAAGLWGIAVARRGLAEETARLFRLETAARARDMESVLAQTRADLAFLAGSPAVSRLEGLGASKDTREDEWRRLAAEAALLVFLRGHPEVPRLTVKAGKGRSLIRTGRRGGVPVLWMSADPSLREDKPSEADEMEGSASGAPRIRGVFAFRGSGADIVRLVAEIDAGALLVHGEAAGGEARRCVLKDASGRALAWDAAAKGEPPATAPLSADGPVRSEGWSAPSPWWLVCAGSRTATAALLDPVMRRYRLTLGLNVGVMAVTLLLGWFAVQQIRRRERLEARAHEEMRIRDLERQLFHTERLSTVGRLAAGMAHEINNPLEGMSNYLSLARDDLDRGDAASASRRLDGVRQGLERAAAIVRQVLAHADPATAPRTPVDVAGLVRQTLDFVKARHEFRDIAIEVDASKSPLVVQGSAVMLGQVLLNVVLNACEAQPQGGAVRVVAQRNGSRVVVEIADRGPGVPPADLVRIFEPFYSTKQSTGLGLSICHSIVRQHDGELSAENRPGGGALFRMSLPAA